MIYAVLSGDIVESSRLTATELDSVMAQIAKAAIVFGAWTSSEVPHKANFARSAGDGWQIAIEEPRMGLRAALYLQATLRSLGKEYSTRIAISVGNGTIPENRDLNFAHGQAFTSSGRLLAAMPRRSLLTHVQGEGADACTCLADHISQQWTCAQASAIRPMLAPVPPKRAAVAESLGISRQAVNQALWSAGYPAISSALACLEKQPSLPTPGTYNASTDN